MIANNNQYVKHSRIPLSFANLDFIVIFIGIFFYLFIIITLCYINIINDKGSNGSDILLLIFVSPLAGCIALIIMFINYRVIMWTENYDDIARIPFIRLFLILIGMEIKFIFTFYSVIFILPMLAISIILFHMDIVNDLFNKRNIYYTTFFLIIFLAISIIYTYVIYKFGLKYIGIFLIHRTEVDKWDFKNDNLKTLE